MQMLPDVTRCYPYFGFLAWGNRKQPREIVTPSGERIATVVILGRLSLIVLAVARGDVCLGVRLFTLTLRARSLKFQELPFMDIKAQSFKDIQELPFKDIKEQPFKNCHSRTPRTAIQGHPRTAIQGHQRTTIQELPFKDTNNCHSRTSKNCHSRTSKNCHSRISKTCHSRTSKNSHSRTITTMLTYRNIKKYYLGLSITFRINQKLSLLLWRTTFWVD